MKTKYKIKKTKQKFHRRNEFSRSGSQNSINRPIRPAPAVPGFHERVAGRRRAPPVPAARCVSEE